MAVGDMYKKPTHIGIPLGVFRVVGTGAAGDYTVTGIKANDILCNVRGEVITTNGSIGAQTDYTSEFNVKADNTCNNAGGTAIAATSALTFTWAKAIG
jgi:hypothetical protein